MLRKVFKIFGLKVFELESYEKNELPVRKLFKGKPTGEVLDYSPEEYQKDREKEEERKLEKH